jgi:hypothetical protein
MLDKHKALGSIPSTATTKKERNNPLVYHCFVVKNSVKVGFVNFSIHYITHMLYWGSSLRTNFFFKCSLRQSHYIVQAGLKLLILLPHPPECRVSLFSMNKTKIPYVTKMITYWLIFLCIQLS